MLDLSIGAWVCLGICVAGILLAKLVRSTNDYETRDWYRDSSPAARELRPRRGNYAVDRRPGRQH
jgi:hypothetical protein